jgi:phosphoglycolate phosphatase-like HAD superfamily hydrolase
MIASAKGRVVYDFDGTIADTFPENFNRLCETWQKIYQRDYPLPQEMVKDAIRPHVLSIADYFSATLLIVDNNYDVPDNIAKLSKSWKRRIAEHHKDVFYQLRTEKRYDDPDAWCEENKVYPGISQMLTEIAELGLDQCVVSSKDAESITMVWKYHGLPRLESVIDNSCGGRHQQFDSLFAFSEIPPSRTVVYDDAADNLEVAKSRGIVVVAAPQGYEVEGKLDGYRQAWPAEFSGVVKELLNI